MDLSLRNEIGLSLMGFIEGAGVRLYLGSEAGVLRL